jgi:hypothetical protein
MHAKLAALFALVAGSWIAPGAASAADVFINGENVTGIRNVTLASARVRIDEQGNVHVDAPGYTVRRVDLPAGPDAGPGRAPPGRIAAAGPPQGGRPSPVAGAASAPGLPPLARRYYLVTSQTVPGMAQFDLEVFVNGASVARARGDADPLIDLLNRHLRPGTNEVRIVARKNLGDAPRRSTSPAHTHRVIIGEGAESGGQVTLQTTLVDYSVDASQTSDMTQVFTITAR